MDAPRSLAPMSVGAPMRLAVRGCPSREPAVTCRRTLIRQTGKQILRIVRFGNEIDALAAIRLFAIQALQIAQRREVVERKAHRIEDGDFVIAQSARAGSRSKMSASSVTSNGAAELLNFTFDTRLRFELDHNAHVRCAQDIRMQFRLAGAIAADGIQMHSRLDHLRRQDNGVALVGRNGGDDVGASHGLGSAVQRVTVRSASCSLVRLRISLAVAADPCRRAAPRERPPCDEMRRPEIHFVRRFQSWP